MTPNARAANAALTANVTSLGINVGSAGGSKARATSAEYAMATRWPASASTICTKKLIG